MAEPLAKVADFLKEGGDLILARVVSGRGSTPRNAGARMIIRSGGQTEGTIGGGLVEAMATNMAAELLTSRVSAVCSMDMNNSDAAVGGMICGGSLELLCEYIPAENGTIHTFDEVKLRHQACRKQFLCTEFHRSGNDLSSVRRYHIHPGGPHEGDPPSPGLVAKLTEMCMALNGSALFEADGRTVCIDIVDGPESLYIFGAGHVAREVAALGDRVGFRTCVLDDRAEFASEARFPVSVEVKVLNSFADCFHGLAIDEHSFVVIVTRGHEHDRAVLGQALRTRAGYIGMIGSTRKRDIIYRALLAEGFTGEDLRRVHSPIGVAIDSETPEEIAVSIVAELIHERSRKR
ncbi:MAG TPA: XdhC/CoxI family protein [Desulfomonilia bacterium]|nr:XdhC/CoxI family protein [Desulfomonilia bacterium]